MRVQTIADQFPAASVLFADVVNFTPRSNGLTAAEVVTLLDRLFGEFDALAERHGRRFSASRLRPTSSANPANARS